jgi:AcrR family transcriptional regulator
MSSTPVTSSLREAHKALTQERIVDAALALFEAEDPDSLTLARVAHAAGVTERTIYRHFATRDELIHASWARMNQQLSNPPAPDSAAALVAHPRHMFPEFEARAALIRAVVWTKQGRELRLSGNAQRKSRIRKAVREARPELDEAAATRLCAVVQLLSSSLAWSSMKDYWNLDGDSAGRAASEAIARLLAPERPQPSAAKRERQRGARERP